MDGNKFIGEKLIDHFSEKGNSNGIDQDMNDWIHSSTENEIAYKIFNKIWTGTSRLSATRKFKPSEAWQKVNGQLMGTIKTVRQVRRLRYATIGMAASLLLLLGFSFYSGLFNSSLNKMKVATAYGSRSELVLPDGSLVKLNTGSSLEYHFNKFSKQREVQFEGEAFFEVEKKKQPFVIYSGYGMELKVLGTKFNLSAYPEESGIKTCLIEGKVELSNSTGEKVTMKPGQTVSFDKKSSQMAFIKENPTHSIGWIEDKIYLDNLSLEQVCSRLERRYDVRISFSPASIGKDIHYTGVLQEETVATVLNALCKLSAINYSINGKEIVITKN